MYTWLEDREGEAEVIPVLRIGTVGIMLSRRTYTVIYGCSRSADLLALMTLYHCYVFPNEKPIKDPNPACFVIRSHVFFLENSFQ